jgi:hypothetical protein
LQRYEIALAAAIFSDVMGINRPDGLADISRLCLTLAEAR